MDVIKFVLINADTDQPIPEFDPLVDGATLTLSRLPTRNLNIRADTSPPAMGSVSFSWDGTEEFRIEDSPPFAFAGNDDSDYHAWTPTPGSHTLAATPFSGHKATCLRGKARTIRFTVKE